MKDEYVLGKLISALNGMPEQELTKLADLLQQPDVFEVLKRLIDDILALKRTERDMKNIARSDARIARTRADLSQMDQPASVRRADDANHSGNGVKGTLVEVLEDRNLFPSTRDVIDAVNRAFGCDYDYDVFRRRGRKDLISKFWIHLSTISEKERSTKMRSFLETYRGTTPVNDYKELFKILSRHE